MKPETPAPATPPQDPPQPSAAARYLDRWEAHLRLLAAKGLATRPDP